MSGLIFSSPSTHTVHSLPYMILYTCSDYKLSYITFLTCMFRHVMNARSSYPLQPSHCPFLPFCKHMGPSNLSWWWVRHVTLVWMGDFPLPYLFTWMMIFVFQDGRNPLQSAVENRRLDIVKMLIEAGDDVNQKDKVGVCAHAQLSQPVLPWFLTNDLLSLIFPKNTIVNTKYATTLHCLLR